jgi:hypothetical protein
MVGRQPVTPITTLNSLAGAVSSIYFLVMIINLIRCVYGCIACLLYSCLFFTPISSVADVCKIKF